MTSHAPQRRKRRVRYRCGRKVGYQTAANAENDRLRLIGRKGESPEASRLQVYHCPECKGFHVGRETRWN